MCVYVYSAEAAIAATPAYECVCDGAWLSAGGEPVAPDTDAYVVTGETLSLRCPHTHTAARMATLIRAVKAEKVCVCLSLSLIFY